MKPIGFRPTFTSRTAMAGCFVCKADGSYIWHGPNAQGVAARHHDATGHTTWCDVNLSIRYGSREAVATRQVTSQCVCHQGAVCGPA